LPIGIISFFFSKKILKRLWGVFAKIDNFDAFVRFKRKTVYMYKTNLSRLMNSLRKKKMKNISYDDKNDEENISVPENTLNDIIKTKSSFSKHPDSFDVSIDEEWDKMMMIKKKKLLEKIIYDALGLRKDGKFDEYEKKIIEWLAIDPEDKDLNKLLADLYFTMENYKKALPILKKIVDMDSNDHKAIWQIGEIYLTSSDFAVAEMLIQKAIGINPTNPKYYISMVELLYNTDRKQDTIPEMEKVIKLRPTNSVYMLTLADLYEELNDFDNAKKYYFRVLECEPSNEKAKKKLKELTGE